MECCGKAAAFVARTVAAEVFCMAHRFVRPSCSNDFVPYGVLRQSRSFRSADCRGRSVLHGTPTRTATCSNDFAPYGVLRQSRSFRSADHLRRSGRTAISNNFAPPKLRLCRSTPKYGHCRRAISSRQSCGFAAALQGAFYCRIWRASAISIRKVSALPYQFSLSMIGNSSVTWASSSVALSLFPNRAWAIAAMANPSQ